MTAKPARRRLSTVGLVSASAGNSIGAEIFFFNLGHDPHPTGPSAGDDSPVLGPTDATCGERGMALRRSARDARQSLSHTRGMWPAPGPVQRPSRVPVERELVRQNHRAQHWLMARPAANRRGELVLWADWHSMSTLIWPCSDARVSGGVQPGSGLLVQW